MRTNGDKHLGPLALGIIVLLTKSNMAERMTIFTDRHINIACTGHAIFLSENHTALPITRYGTKYSMAKHKQNAKSCGSVTIVIGVVKNSHEVGFSNRAIIEQ